MYGTTLDFSDPFDPWKFIWAMTEQQGGYFVSPDLKTAGLNSDQTLNATTGYFDLLTKYHLADPASVGWKSGDAIAAFSQGKAAMYPMTTAQAIPTLDKSPLQGHYAFASLPTVAPGRPSAPRARSRRRPSCPVTISPSRPTPRTRTWRCSFIDLFTSTDQQLANYEAFGNLPTNQDAMNQLSAQNALLAPFLEIESNSTPTAFTGAWADVQNGVTNVVTQSQPSLADGSYDTGAVKALLDTANTSAQSALDRAQKSDGSTRWQGRPRPCHRQPSPGAPAPRRGDIRGRPLWLMWPNLILLIVVIVIPFLIGVYISFLDLDQYTLRKFFKAPFIGFQNYVEAFTSAGLLHSIWISLAFSFLTTAGLHADRACWRRWRSTPASVGASWFGRRSWSRT